MPKRKTTLQFVEEAKALYGDKYDYSKVNYINNYTKVEIICPIHGSFYMTPNNFLKNHKCPGCANHIKLTKENFIERASKIHNNYYDYSLFDAHSVKDKIKIICPTHGIFEQQVAVHLRGHGCPQCKADGVRVSLEYFLESCNKIHNNKYDYSLIENWIGAMSMIEIICPIHGTFLQLAKNHLKGCGCPKCQSSKGEREIYQWLNENNIKFEQQKIFNECKDKKCLPFDFYLPSFNCCIEYQGMQHFKPIEHFGGQETLNYIMNHDRIKKNFCKKENIILLTINYNEDIKQKLESLLLLNKQC